MEYRLAIDIGASSGRHILGHFEDGKLVTEEIYRFPNGFEINGGRFYWNIYNLFENIRIGLGKCAELGKIPSSIGIDTWGVDYALLDSDGKLIDGVIAYRDARTAKIPERVYKTVPKRELYARTGIAEHSFNTIFQLYEDKLSGRLSNAETLLFIPCYLNYLLTGVIKNEYTFASTSGLLGAESRDWDYELINKLGLPEKLFGKLYGPGEVVGDLLPEIAGFTCPVVLTTAHDTASAVAAVEDSNELWISSGTWSLIGTECRDPILTEDAEAAGFTNEGGVDGKIRFLKNIMGLWIIQSLKRELGGEYGYEDLMRLASSSGYDFPLDVNAPILLAPENMQEAIKKVLRSNGAPETRDVGELIRSVYLGLSEEYARSADEIERLTGKKFDKIVIVGGGSRDALLNRLTAEKSGRQVVTGNAEATAVGNLLVQFNKSK